MRRPAKGGTTHPNQERPGMGYGRPLRPRPGPVASADVLAEVSAFLRGEPSPPVVDATPWADERSPVTGLDRRS
jgi:hypothetical protein